MGDRGMLPASECHLLARTHARTRLIQPDAGGRHRDIPNMSLICPLYVPNISLICPLYVSYMSLICPLYALIGSFNKTMQGDIEIPALDGDKVCV